MIPTQMQKYIVRKDTPAVYAFYIVNTNPLYPIALVCDDHDALVGVISGGNMELHRTGDLINKNCWEICNRNFTFMDNQDENDIYEKARSLFAEKNFTTLPIVDEHGAPVRLFGKFQAFFRDWHNATPKYWYRHYAVGLMDAASFAVSKGYDRISAIEFGVAGGNGLIHMELFAREVQRLFGIGIDVYGFDSGKGLFAAVDYRDCPQVWAEGDYKGDIDALRSRLYAAKLVVGDICDTARTFLAEYAPAPIGFISVDVDRYTPTVAILDMLLGDDKYFLPAIRMYFDDLFDSWQCQGEDLAIREFNAKNETMKIVPERASALGNDARRKWCNRFNHPLFPTAGKPNGELVLR